MVFRAIISKQSYIQDAEPISFRYAEECGKEWASRTILQIEQQYPPVMRSTAEDVAEIITDEGAIVIFGFMDGRCFGNVHGCTDDNSKDTVYVYNLAVHSDFQGKGLGHRLMEQFITSAKEKGFKRIAGHFRHNGSLKIAQSFGARTVQVIEDWDGTGEPFSHCVIDL